MSWLIVFMSTLFPLVLLAILMTLNWSHREHGSRPASLKPVEKNGDILGFGVAHRSKTAGFISV